jgi:glycosyltransferase involved in cell wall biosynthesis
MSDFKVLHITNAMPSDDFPGYGVFIKEQIHSLQDPALTNTWFINGRQQGKWAYVKALFQFTSRIRNYDIIHCHHIYVGLLAALVAPRKKKVVSFLSDEFNLSTHGWKRWMYRFVVRNAQARIYKKAIPPNLLQDPLSKYLPNGVDIDFFKPGHKNDACQLLGLNPNARYLLFVSGNDLYRPEKRYVLLESALQILKRNPQFQDVEILPMVKVSREQVPAYFQASEMHVLTSLYEGSPNSVKESMACNVPVLATPVGNVREMISDAPHCRIIEDESPQYIAQQISEMLNRAETPDLRAVLIQKGLDMASVAIQLKALYSQVFNLKM